MFNITIKAKQNLRESNFSNIRIHNSSSSLSQFIPLTSSSSYPLDTNISLILSDNIFSTQFLFFLRSPSIVLAFGFSGFWTMDRFNVPETVLKKCSQKDKQYGRTEISEVFVFFPFIFMLSFSNLVLSTAVCFDFHNLHKIFLI